MKERMLVDVIGSVDPRGYFDPPGGSPKIREGHTPSLIVIDFQGTPLRVYGAFQTPSLIYLCLLVRKI